eukprot:m.1878 g.1878  ORF g.1878 m.1878 type:complete len:57 (-) comp1655_c0_seq1:288-458(-)
MSIINGILLEFNEVLSNFNGFFIGRSVLPYIMLCIFQKPKWAYSKFGVFSDIQQLV